MFSRIWFWMICQFDDRRGLFFFHDGSRFRRVDALMIARQLFTHSRFDWDETPQLLQSGVATTQLAAFALIAETIRDVFRILPVESGGLTDLGCADLLASFREFLGDVKKNGSLFPILKDSFPEPSATLPIPEKPILDCGSTPSEPSVEPPGSPVELTSEGSVN